MTRSAEANGGAAATVESDASGRHTFSPRFMAPLVVGAALNPVNSSLIATALVPLASSLHVSVGHTAVLISSLYLTSAIAQPTFGRLAEEFGPRRIFLAGIAIVFAAGVVGGLAQNMTTLVVARVLVGLGTSAGYPAAMLLIRRRATAIGLQSPPGRILGHLTVTSAVTLAVGPTVGGLMVTWFGWRATFLVNIPVALLAFAMAALWIAVDPDAVRGSSIRGLAGRVDVPGIAAFGVAITGALVFLLALPTLRWMVLGIVAAGIGALVLIELRARAPFIDVRLLASNGPLTRTYLRYALTLLGIYLMLYGFPQWLEGSYGMSPFHAGLALIPMGVLSAATSRLVARRPKLRPSLIAAAILLVTAAAAQALLNRHSPLIAIIAVTAMFGLVAGFGNVTNQTVLYREAPPEKVGTAAGLLRTCGYMGSIGAATVTGFLFRVRVTDGGLRLASIILAVIGVVVFLITVGDVQLRRSDDELDAVP